MKNKMIRSASLLILTAAFVSCTGNYLAINSNPYEVTKEQMDSLAGSNELWRTPLCGISLEQLLVGTLCGKLQSEISAPT